MLRLNTDGEVDEAVTAIILPAPSSCSLQTVPSIVNLVVRIAGVNPDRPVVSSYAYGLTREVS